MSDPFAPIGSSAGGGDGGTPGFVCVVPIPADAPSRPTHHPQLGAPSTTWTYRDAAGDVTGYVNRFDGAGGKEFRPLTLWRAIAGGALSWRWQAWPAPRPLYGLDRLAARPDAPVLVCEGEKAADAAGQLAPDHVAITSPNGSKSAGKADWTPLAGRRVVIWPDADDAGHAYGKAAAKAVREAGAAGVAVLAPPEGSGEGWDAADALAEGWTAERTAELLRTARAPLAAVEGGKGSGRPGGSQRGRRDGSAEPRPKRVPQRDIIMAMAEPAELWRGKNRRAMATFPIDGHRETWPVRSSPFREWLSERVYAETGAVPGSQAIEDALRVLEARSGRARVERDTWLRVGQQDGRIFVDMGDVDWTAVEIDANGWGIIENHALPFTRAGAMKALPEPQGGYDIAELRRFVNVASDEDFALVVAWLLAALRPRGPYPILTINGEQGSGKSTFSKILRSLVDPNDSPIRAAPGDDRDLIVMAHHSHAVVIDNVSSVPHWLSDGLCRLATGGGFSTRRLHSDDEEVVFMAVRPIILNGIPSMTDRPDLADRAVNVRLSTIPEDMRRSEEDFDADWEETRPRVLGALFDALSRGLGRIKSVKLDRMPRMADFVRWIVACEPGLGWDEGTFLAAYEHNRAGVTETTFEADAVAVAIEKMMVMEMHQRGWSGTMTELLPILTELVPTAMQKSRVWPTTAVGLGDRVARAIGLLRSKGILVEKKQSSKRLVSIVWKAI